MPEDIFEGFDPTPETPAAPLASDDPFAGFDPTPPADPVARGAAKQLRAAFVDGDTAALRAQEPILSTRGDFAPHTFPRGTRNYISEWSSGLLDLPDTAFTAAQEDTAAALAYRDLTTARPNLGRLVAERPDLQAPLLSHIRATVRLKNTPASPREILDAGDAATADWLAASQAGTLTQNGEPLRVPPDIPPAAVRDLWAKTHALTIGETEDQLVGAEKDLYTALGGAQWLQFQKSHKAFYVGQARRDRLLGRPTRDTSQPPTIEASIFGGGGSVPTESPVSFEDLEHVSSFASGVLAEAQQAGIAQAQAQTDLRNSLQYRTLGGLLGPDISQGVASFTGATGEADDQGIISASGRRLATVGTNLFSTSVQGANEIVAPGLNLLTLGHLNGILEDVSHVAQGVGGIYSLTTNLLQGKYDATTDPEFLNRKIQQATHMIGRSLALGAPEGHDDRKAASELEFIESAFPDMDADAKRELRQSYFGGSQAVSGFLRRASEGALGGPLELFSKVFRADSPYLQRVAGENMGPLLESSEGLAFTLLGASQLYSTVFRKSALKRFYDPKRRDAYTNLDQHLAATGQFNQAGTAYRAQLLDEINTKIGKIPDANAAHEFVSRVERSYRDHGAPLTPGLKAKIDTAAGRFTDKVEDLQGRALSEADKAAVLDLAEPIADLPFIDQQFAITGQDAFMSTEGSALKVKRLQTWYENQVKLIEELELPRQLDRSVEKMVQIQEGLIEHATRERDLNSRKARLVEVTNTLVEDLAAKAQEHHKSTHVWGQLRTAAVTNFHKYVRGAVKENTAAETTGATYSRANPRIHEPVFERLTTAVLDGGKKLQALLTDRDLATPTRAKLLERLKAEDGTAIDNVEAAVRAWARDEIRDRSAPILSERLLQTEKSAAIADEINTALDNAEVSGEPVVLTQAQKNWLDKHSENRGGRPFNTFKAAAADALERDVMDAHRKADEAVALAQELRKLQFAAKHATVDTPRLKIPKKLRKQIIEALEEFDIPLEKKYVPLASDASSLEVSALEAFKESIEDLSDEHRALVNGERKLASFEMAAFGKATPHIVRHELTWTDRAAEGALHWSRYLGKKLDRLLGRQVSKAERQQIYSDMKSGKPSTAAAASLMQDQRIRMVGDMRKAGVITPEHYAEMLGNSYAHNLFDRETQAELANTLEFQRRTTPSGYAALAVDPAALKFRIPENGNEYVTWRDDKGRLHSKDGFETYEDALAWANENIPAGREIAFAKTWPVVEKALSGLVEDAGIAHLDMVESLSLATHNARIGEFIANSPYAKRASDAADLASRGEGQFSPSGDIFETKRGERFLKWNNPKNPWLEGRYVSVEATKWLEEFKSGYGFARELAAAAQDVHPIRGDLMGPQWKYFLRPLVNTGVGGLRLANNLFPIKNIALSASTIVKNWTSNFLINSRFAGVNFLHPVEFAYGLKDAIDGYKAYSNPKLDPDWQALAEADIVRFGNEADYYRDGPGAPHSRATVASLEKNWRSLEPLLARKKTLEGRIYGGAFKTEEALESAEFELMSLENEIRGVSQKSARSSFQAFMGHGIGLAGELYNSLIHGKGKLHNALWNNFYTEVTGDRIVKYMTYKALLRKGLSKEAALHRVADFHQQLHRVPEMARKIGRTIGGGMFTAFPVDQARIFGNVLRQDPAAFLRLSLLLSGWNSVAIATSGNSTEDYLESWALQHGVRRDGISDAQALMSGFIIPGGLGTSESGGGLYSLSLGSGLWDSFKPQSRSGRSLASMAKGDTDNAAAALAADATLGTLSKYFGADLYTQLITGIADKTDERGDPMKTAGDTLQWLNRLLLTPRGLPGSHEYGVMSRALSGEEVNLASGRKVPFNQAFAETYLGTRVEMDTPSRFRSALMTQIRDHAGGLTDFRRAEQQDAQLATLLARGATNADGSLNLDKAVPVIRQYKLDNPTHYRRPDQIKVVESYDEDDITRALDEYGKPKTLRTFNRQPLNLQIAAYALWRGVDSLAPQRDPEWYGQVRQMILEKVVGPKRYSPTEIQDINIRIEEALNSGRLPPDAVEDLRTFQVLLSKRVSKR